VSRLLFCTIVLGDELFLTHLVCIRVLYCVVCVRGEAAGDVAKNFIERWEHARITSESGILIDPMFKHGRPSLAKMPRIHSKPIINGDTGDVLGSGHSASEVDIAASPMPLYTGGFASRGTASSCKCQIVRSLSGWSGTQGDTEISHYEAWISSINRAESFIYIEQQYFVCSMGVTDAKNRVAEAILERVRHAIEHSKPFRVYVVIPATVYMTIVNHFTRRTLLQDGGRNNGWVKRRNRQREKSLMTRIRILLRKVAPGSYWDGKSAESLLSVCFLSSVGKSMSGRWEVGEVFIHSKVLVVDDKIAVIGSANVNDRSFVGNSDSEIGVILTDGDNPNPENVGCVKDFRLRLWRQYLGLSLDGQDDDAISNPASDEAYDRWYSTASSNQSIISSVFDHFPGNSIACYSDYLKLKNRYNNKRPEERAASLENPERLEKVQGILTEYPQGFLADDKKRTFAHMILEEFPLRATL